MRPLSLLLIGMVLGCAPRIQHDPYVIPRPSWVDSSLHQKLEVSRATFEEKARAQVGCRLVLIDLPSPRAVRAFRDKFLPIHGENYHMVSALFGDCRVEDVWADLSQVPEASYFKTPVATYTVMREGTDEDSPVLFSRHAIGFDDERGVYWDIRITDWVAQRALIWFSAQGRIVTDSDSAEPPQTWNVTEHVPLAPEMLSIHLAESEDGSEATAILVELVQLHEYSPGSNEFALGE